MIEYHPPDSQPTSHPAPTHCVAPIAPITCNLLKGVVVPIPTYPIPQSTVNFQVSVHICKSEPPSARRTVSPSFIPPCNHPLTEVPIYVVVAHAPSKRIYD